MRVSVAAMLLMGLCAFLGCSSDDAPNNEASDAGDAGDAGTVPEAAPPLACEGTVLNPRPWQECVGDGFCRCRGYAPDGGTLVLSAPPNGIMSITSMLLPVAMTAGQPYSLAATFSNGGFIGDIEFWGTTSECGPGLERLFTEPVDSKTYCVDVVPAEDYGYVLFVERLINASGAPAGAEAGNIVGCPTGRCPSAP
jgi:hypothetical protein